MSPPARAANVLRRAFEFTQRERRFVLDQLAQVKGLMPLLMKRRNRSNWAPEDLAQIRGHFTRHLLEELRQAIWRKGRK